MVSVWKNFKKTYFQRHKKSRQFDGISLCNIDCRSSKYFGWDFFLLVAYAEIVFQRKEDSRWDQKLQEKQQGMLKISTS